MERDGRADGAGGGLGGRGSEQRGEPLGHGWVVGATQGAGSGEANRSTSACSGPGRKVLTAPVSRFSFSASLPSSCSSLSGKSALHAVVPRAQPRVTAPTRPSANSPLRASVRFADRPRAGQPSSVRSTRRAAAVSELVGTQGGTVGVLRRTQCRSCGCRPTPTPSSRAQTRRRRDAPRPAACTDGTATGARAGGCRCVLPRWTEASALLAAAHSRTPKVGWGTQVLRAGWGSSSLRAGWRSA